MNASRAMLLVWVLTVATGCSSNRDTANMNPNLGSVSLKVQIGNSNGLTLSSVTYDIIGPTEYTGMLSSPAGSHSISGRIGQIVPGTYRLTLTGHPDTEPAIACTGASGSFTVEAGKAAAANVSLVCVQHVTADGGLPTNGMIDVSGTFWVCCDDTCAILLNDTASSLEIPADGVTTVTLTGSVTVMSPPAELVWSAPSGKLSASNGNTVAFTCNPSLTDSLVPVTIAVQSVLPQCPPSGDTIDIACSGVGALPGSGGATSTGGAAGPGGTGGLQSTCGSDCMGISILSNYTNGNPVYDCTQNCADGAASGCRQFECASQLCLDLLQCIMPPGGYHYGGSCYDYDGTDTAISCYCGTADSTECTTVGGNGVCAAQETAAGLTPGTVLTGFHDPSTPAGKVNAYVNCISTACGCFWGNGYNSGGGNSTGGAPGAGGSTSTGGSIASGGTNSTSGTANSTAPNLLSPIILAYTAGNPEYVCTPSCAQNCSQFTCTSSVCLDLLQCIMPPSGYHDAGSCYDYAGANTAISCYCGTADSTECRTVGGNGVCAAQETAAGLTPETVLTGFTDVSTSAGKVNAYVNCLSNYCGCFW